MAAEYDEETADFWKLFPRDIIDNFQKVLPQGAVLDVGSGPGRDGVILRASGLRIICLDASTTMASITKQKGLLSVLADFLEIPFVNESFSGVWAYTSLLHINKLDLPTALKECRRVLKPNGILGLGMIEGQGEGNRFSSGVNRPRYFTYYSKEEIESCFLTVGFNPFFFQSFQPRSKNYLHFLAQKA